MLYESTYNQYFLEHSWGPWKKHLYISRDGESGDYTYEYPKEYYDEYDLKKREMHAKVQGARNRGDISKAIEYSRAASPYDVRKADENSEFYNEYYDSNFDKIINRSVKKAVDALNFAHDTRVKAEGYLNRFANAVKDAWNGAKSPDRTRVQAGKKFVSDLWNYAKNTVTAKKITSSIQNLVKGAGEAVKKGWNDTKKKASTTKTKVMNAVTGASKNRNPVERNRNTQNMKN